MDLELQGRRVLITGASKGIGFACAEAFAREGCRLDLVARDISALASAADRLKSAYDVEIVTHAADLSRSQDQHRLLESVTGLDILVNNAGSIPAGDLERIDEAKWREAWDLKVFGYINLCRLVLPKLQAQSRGVIINIIGGAAVKPRPNYIAGAAGNAGLQAFTQALGSETLKHGVRVVGVNPGLITTDRMITLMRTRADEHFGDPERWREMIPSDPPPGRPDQIADVVVFLASERAGHVSAEVITVDGGATFR